MAQNGLEMDSATEERLLSDDIKTEEYEKLTEYGISEKVAEELVKIYKTGVLALQYQIYLHIFRSGTLTRSGYIDTSV